MKFLKKIISVVCLNVFAALMSVTCVDGLVLDVRSEQAGELRMTVRDENGTKRLLCPDQPTYLHETIFFLFPDDVSGWEVRVDDGLWKETGGGSYTVGVGEIEAGEALSLCFRALDKEGHIVSSRSYTLTADGL